MLKSPNDPLQNLVAHLQTIRGAPRQSTALDPAPHLGGLDARLWPYGGMTRTWSQVAGHLTRPIGLRGYLLRLGTLRLGSQRSKGERKEVESHVWDGLMLMERVERGGKEGFPFEGISLREWGSDPTQNRQQPAKDMISCKDQP